MKMSDGVSCAEIIPDEKGWAAVWFWNAIENMPKVYFGSEDRDVIYKKIKRILTDFNQASSGEIDGIRVRWVLSLAEKHTALYATYPDHDGVIRLYWQDVDSDGKIVGRMILGVVNQKEWVQQLSKS